MNYHHGLLRLGVVEKRRIGDHGWAYFEVDFFEDDIHERKVAWDKKMNSGKDTLKREQTGSIPVSPSGCEMFCLHGEYQDERRTENG